MEKRRTIVNLFISIMLIFMLTITVDAETSDSELGAKITNGSISENNIASGKSGDLYWYIDLEGVLTIEGTGDYEVTWDYENLQYKTAWNEYSDSIKQAVVRVDGITRTEEMFAGCSEMLSVELNDFDISEVTDMRHMFMGCSSLVSLDLSTFDTSCVTNMVGMFMGCSSLVELDLSTFDTSKVTNMNCMFDGCSSLTSLDVSNFNTSQVTNMSAMFGGCSSLTSIDVSNFDTSLVTDMSWMFGACSNLVDLTVSNFNTSNVTDMRYMFFEYNGETLDVRNFDTSKVTSMRAMFERCKNIASLDVSNFKTSQVTDMTWMFCDCPNLDSLELSKFDMSQITESDNIFAGCSHLTQISLPQNINVSIEFPSVEGYCWRDSNGKVCAMATTNLSTSMVYTRISNTNSGGNNDENSNTSPETNQGGDDKTENETGIPENDHNVNVPASSAPKAVGTNLTAPQGQGTYTVTSADASNPTVAFNGLEDENAKAVIIPETVTIDGVTYKVTTVSIDSFEQKDTGAKYQVTDNSVKNLAIEYTGNSNKKKKSVSIPENVTYKGVKFKVTSVKTKAFKGNKKLTKIKIATGITKIGNSAFEGCTNLKSVTIGKSLTTIGKNAFKNCKKLTKITIKSSKLKSVGKNALKGVNAKCKIKVPATKVKKYQKLFKGKGQKKSVKIIK